MHLGQRDARHDALALADAADIRHRLWQTPRAAVLAAVPDAHLNLISHACDVGLNTATGEGWGLGAFAHAATGAAQLVPDHSTCTELWRDSGLLLPVAGTPTTPGLVSVPETAAALQHVYSDRALLRQLSARALAYATAARFSWPQVVAAWHTLLRSL